MAVSKFRNSKKFKNLKFFFKEKVEYERLKLEEQISMLEKVIEEGIKQTTELQEIHHSEVEDLHKQVCSKKFEKIQKFSEIFTKKNYEFLCLLNFKIFIFVNFEKLRLSPEHRSRKIEAISGLSL